jgi:hypothetical protein
MFVVMVTMYGLSEVLMYVHLKNISGGNSFKKWNI